MSAAPSRTSSVPLPLSGKKNLQHLVGRQLVPFFLPGEKHDEIKENTSHVMPQGEDFTQGISSVPVRSFVDGYFVDSGTLTDNAPTTTTTTTTTTDKRKKPSQTPVKVKKDKEKYATIPAPIKPVPTTTTTITTRFAAPAFVNSPSPMKVPLPKFITQTTTTNMSVVPEHDEQRHAMHLLRTKSTEEPEHHYTTHKQSPSLPPHLVTSTSSIPSASDPGQALIQLLRAGTYAHPTTTTTIPPITTPTTTTTTPTTTDTTVTTPRLLLLRQDSSGSVAVQSIPVSVQEPDYSSKMYRLPTKTTTTSPSPKYSPTTSTPQYSPTSTTTTSQYNTTPYNTTTTITPYFPPTIKPSQQDDTTHLQATLKSLLSIR